MDAGAGGNRGTDGGAKEAPKCGIETDNTCAVENRKRAAPKQNEYEVD